MHFLILLQKRDFNAAWEVPWIWETQVLMEEENSPCVALHPTECVFNWSLLLPSPHRLFVKCIWRKGGINSRSEHCVHVQLWIFPFELYVFGIGHLIAASVQVLSPTLEIISSHISNDPCWLGDMGTRGKWLFIDSCLWDSSKDQAASGISRELIVRFSSRYFKLKTTESGTMSKIHCVPLLETVICIVLIVKERVVSWRKFWKMKRKVNFCGNKADNTSVTGSFHIK